MQRWEFRFNLTDKGKDPLNGRLDQRIDFLAQNRW
jgi:hypothetical protein